MTKPTSTTSKRILLVEDEPNLAFTLELNLKAEGYEVVVSGDGAEAWELYKSQGPWDLAILDVQLPGMDGFSLAKKIRALAATLGILILTARASDEDRLLGLELGVDDYLTKPFHLQELLLRIKRMLERSSYLRTAASTQSPAKSIIVLGKMALDCDHLTFTNGEKSFAVTALEADVLREFMRNPGQVLSREYLLEHVWGMTGRVETRTVDIFIARIRRYLDGNSPKESHIRAVRGRGYVLDAESEAP